MLTLLSILGLGLSGCGNPLGPASSTPATFQPGLETGSPYNLIYSSPVSYTKNSVIASNSPTSSGSTITSYSISPSLPAGLVFDTTTGIISGTPSVITTASTYTVTGTNASGSTTFPLMLTVNDIVPSISYPGSPFTFTKNSAIANQTPTNSGGAVISCSSSPALPTGLSLSSTCELSGTPTVVSGSTSYTITATNSGGSTTASISITVNDIAPATLAYAGSPFTFTRNSAITAQTPTSSGGAITSCGSAPTLPTGLSLSSSCVLSGTPTVIQGSTSYTITATNSGGSTTASISITVNDIVPVIAYAGTPFTFTRNSAITAQPALNTGGAITGCSILPALPTGLSLSSACTLSGTPTVVSGTTSYTVTATNSGGSGTVSISITVNDIAPATLAYAGSPFTFTRNSAITSQTPTSSGGAITSCGSAPALPTGLSLSSACVLSGTPTVIAGSTSYTITATNSGGSTTASISITVNDIAPATLAYAGSPFTFTKDSVITAQTPTSSGGTITSCGSAPALPTGLSLSSACILSGTPTVIQGSTSYTITATNSGGSTTASISITVNDIVPSIAYSPSSFTLTKDLAISTITPANTGGTVTSCSSSPALPTGLSLSSTCVITGTPTVIQGSASYDITATNSGGSQAAVTISFTVSSGATQLSFFVGPPANGSRSVSLSPTIQIRALDSGGSLDTTYTGNITISFDTNPTTATLSGTLTVAAVAGVASFSTLKINKAGTGYKIAASASPLTSAVSSTFNVKCDAPLDTIAAPAAAYSLRLISNSYAGPIIRVRRSSDSGEQDIYSDAASCGLDTTALLSFVGAGIGFVKTWYDQTGNIKHATQTTAGSQPVIVTAGVVEMLNSMPTIKFNGSTFIPGVALGIAATGGFSQLVLQRSVTLVSGGTNDGNGTYFFDRTTGTNNLTGMKNCAGKICLQKRTDASSGLGGVTSVSSISLTNIQSLYSERQRGTAYRVYMNNTFEASLADADGNITPPPPQIGRHVSTTTASSFGVFELYFWPTITSSGDRSTLHSSQQLFYGF